jgi:hypothetical protein
MSRGALLRLGGLPMGDDDRHSVLPASFAFAKPAAVRVGRAPAEPSWGRVLATTVRLWVWRRRPTGFRQRTVSGWPSRKWLRASPGRQRHLTAPWRRGALVLALVVVTVAALEFTGVFSRTAAQAARSPVGTRGTSPRDAAVKAQAQAAAWIAGQVSSDAIVACYPAMCAALQAHGVNGGRLLPLGPGPAGPPSANVLAISSSLVSQLADEYAPGVIASFGAGSDRIEVRAVAPGGAAAYESALRADLAARKIAGPQLLRNSRIRFTAPEAGQLRAGEVDSRLLATLAALSSVYSFRVTAFGDASPGAQVLFREVTITAGRTGDGAAELAGARALVLAQASPFLPAHATIIHLTSGQAALTVEFAAPSPLGLLTAVLAVDTQA